MCRPLLAYRVTAQNTDNVLKNLDCSYTCSSLLLNWRQTVKTNSKSAILQHVKSFGWRAVKTSKLFHGAHVFLVWKDWNNQTCLINKASFSIEITWPPRPLHFLSGTHPIRPRCSPDPVNTFIIPARLWENYPEYLTNKPGNAFVWHTEPSICLQGSPFQRAERSSAEPHSLMIPPL